MHVAVIKYSSEGMSTSVFTYSVSLFFKLVSGGWFVFAREQYLDIKIETVLLGQVIPGCEGTTETGVQRKFAIFRFGREGINHNVEPKYYKTVHCGCRTCCCCCVYECLCNKTSRYKFITIYFSYD